MRAYRYLKMASKMEDVKETPTPTGDENDEKKKKSNMDNIMSKIMDIEDDAEDIARKKKAKDLSALVDKVIPEAETKAAKGHLNDCIETLLVAEKQTRQGGDISSTSRILVKVVEICATSRRWDLLNDNLVLLSKRRGQLKTSVQKMVQQAMTYIDGELSDKGATRLKLIDTLLEITTGKIFVEIERARLSRILAKTKEEEGDVSAAAKILREVQVETFGAMEKKEKTEFILEQIRLCIDDSDFIRAQIMSRKISRKVLAEEGLEEQSVRFYELMVRYHANDADFLEIARCYQAIFENPTVKENVERRESVLKLLIVYAALAPFDAESSDLRHRVLAEKSVRDLPEYRALLKFFQTMEIMRWNVIEQMYRVTLNKHDCFSDPITRTNGEVLDLWKALKNRVVEHNVRVISTYYDRISMKRLTALLEPLTVDEAERFVCDLVVAKTIKAKIDRPTGVITFVQRKDEGDRLNDWSGDVRQLLTLVEETNHLINKERILHKSQLEEDERKHISKPLKMELANRGAAIVNDLSAVTSAVRKQAQVREEVAKVSKSFASVDITMESTSHMLNEIKIVLGDLDVQSTSISESVQKLPRLSEVFSDTAAECGRIQLLEQQETKDP